MRFFFQFSSYLYESLDITKHKKEPYNQLREKAKKRKRKEYMWAYI